MAGMGELVRSDHGEKLQWMRGINTLQIRTITIVCMSVMKHFFAFSLHLFWCLFLLVQLIKARFCVSISHFPGWQLNI